MAYGGRGGGKSFAVADVLLIQGVEQPLRILCAREFQNSIEDSVHRLLSDEIKRLGLQNFYSVLKTEIRGLNGTYIGFEGLRRNIASLKSWEGADRCWVEEADTVSDESWDVLIPTIRKGGSEIIVTFNPKLEDDPTYKRFVLNPPRDAIVVHVNGEDNPWLPETLKRESDELRERDLDKWLHIYGGRCVQTLEGAVFANELRQADAENRITDVPYYQGKPVDTFWDLGYRDSTAIWLIQQVGVQTRVIDYVEGTGKPISWYVEQLQARPYVWGTDYLPHDAAAKELGSGTSLQEQVSALNRRVQIVPRIHAVGAGIEALRSAFGSMWFDRTKCAAGINHLRRYRYVTSTTGVTGREPLHDAASHAADALRQFGQMSQSLAGAGQWVNVKTTRRRVV